MDPAGAEALGVGGVHQIAHHEAAVLQIGVCARISQDHEHHRRSVKRVYAVVFEHAGVQSAEAVAHFPVSNRNDNGTLAVHAGGGIRACLADFLNHIHRRHLVSVLTHTAACQQILHCNVFLGVVIDDCGHCLLFTRITQQHRRRTQHHCKFSHIKFGFI